MKKKTVLMLALMLAVWLVSASVAQACENEDVVADDTEEMEMMEICFKSLEDECNAEILDLNSGVTVLEAKEVLASALNEGVSPEEIYLLYDADFSVRELIEDDGTLAEYDIEDGDTVYYVISPLPMGACYESGGTIDFGPEVACVYDEEQGVSWLCGENAISFQGYERYQGMLTAKFVIGNTKLRFRVNSELNEGDLVLRVSYIEYNHYDDEFRYGFDVI